MVGGGKTRSEEEKKYCRHCGQKSVVVPSGEYDEYTGEIIYAKECQNVDCKVGKY